MSKIIDVINEKLVHKKIINIVPKDFTNLIIYGCDKAKKYNHALQIIQSYSPSKLNYEKKMVVTYNKNEYNYKLSDVHIEINCEFLGCISKNLWDTIYNHILQLVTNKDFFVLCKNFSAINNELLEHFYIYMNNNNKKNIKFIILTDHISFIPSCIVNCSTLIPIKKLPVSATKEISITHSYLDKIMMIINNTTTFNIKLIRSTLYDLLIYQINIHDFFYKLFQEIHKQFDLSIHKTNKLLNEINKIFKLYNNNYRSIYHLENLIVSIISIIHFMK